MLNLYIAKVLEDALEYLPKLSIEFQNRVNKNKKKEKKLQMITGELLLNYGLKDSGYKGKVKTNYLPKLVLVGNDLNISKSHSHDYVLVTVSSENSGCDIEKFRNIKKPEKLLAEKELLHYNHVSESEKAAVFTMYWTAKEAAIKYHGALREKYSEMFFDIEKNINNFNAGKIAHLYCYQGFFKDYSFAVVTKELIAPVVLFVGSNSLKETFG